MHYYGWGGWNGWRGWNGHGHGYGFGRRFFFGFTAVSLFANFAYAGMKAQGNNQDGRTLAFILGLPGTGISYFAVKEGSERAYGVDLPKKILPVVPSSSI